MDIQTTTFADRIRTLMESGSRGDMTEKNYRLGRKLVLIKDRGLLTLEESLQVDQALLLMQEGR